MPEVNPEILAWARETTGLTPEEAVRKLGFKDARKWTAVERLRDYEAGRDAPSRSVLVRMAKQYRRPLLTFYLSKPPRKGDRGADFRILRDRPSPKVDAELDALIRDVRARQSMVRAALEDEDEAESLPFIGSKNLSDGQAAVLSALQDLLGVESGEYHAKSGAKAAFNMLRKATEEARVFVLLKGDLGSYHTAIDVEVFRGFVISDDVAPFVVVNDRDAVSAWSFTLLHELVHLLFGQTGVGNGRRENELERFCDSVAGDFLLPLDELERFEFNGAAGLDATTEHRISEFARQRNLSRSMVAYQAYRAGVVNQADLNRLLGAFRQKWIEERAAQRERASQREGGPDYYVVRRDRVGNGLTDLVSRMMDSQSLSTTRAARILGVKPHQVQAMLSGG